MAQHHAACTRESTQFTVCYTRSNCPFQNTGIETLPLVEDPALEQGSTTIIENPDGTQTVSVPVTSNHCQHDAMFFANPDYEAIINQQQWEMGQRAAAAEAAAEQAQQ